MSVVHLEAIQSLTPTAAHDALMADDPAYGLTLEDYAERAADGGGGLFPAHTADQTARIMKFWDTFFGGRPSSKKRDLTPSSILAQFFEFMVNRTSQQEVLPVPSLNWTAMGDATSPVSGQFLHLGTQALVLDLPLHAVHFINKAHETGLFSKGVMAGQSLVSVGYASVVALASVARDVVTGKMSMAPLHSMWLAHEPLSNITARVVNSLGDVAMRTMGVRTGGPVALYNTILNLMDRSEKARYHRYAIGRVMQLTTSSFIRNFVSEEDYDKYGVLPILSAAVNTSTLACLSPYPELCANCLYLDQLLGHVIGGSNQSLSYYSAEGTQEPSFNLTESRYEALDAYLVDRTTPAEIGDASYLPIRWPWYVLGGILRAPPENTEHFSTVFLLTAAFQGTTTPTGASWATRHPIRSASVTWVNSSRTSWTLSLDPRVPAMCSPRYTRQPTPLSRVHAGRVRFFVLRCFNDLTHRIYRHQRSLCFHCQRRDRRTHIPYRPRQCH